MSSCLQSPMRLSSIKCRPFMYIVVQGQIIMLIALSRASCKLFFICVEIVQLFEVTMILCFFSLVNKSCSRPPQKTEESGSEKIGLQGRKRRGAA